MMRFKEILDLIHCTGCLCPLQLSKLSDRKDDWRKGWGIYFSPLLSPWVMAPAFWRPLPLSYEFLIGPFSSLQAFISRATPSHLGASLHQLFSPLLYLYTQSHQQTFSYPFGCISFLLSDPY